MASQITQPFIHAQIKENIKALLHWPLWGEFTGDRWIPLTKAGNTEIVAIWWRHHVSIRVIEDDIQAGYDTCVSLYYKFSIWQTHSLVFTNM